MVKKAMVTSTLTEEMIVAGWKLLDYLDQAGLPVQAALWLHNPESEVWRLVIALPEVKAKGPLQAYHRILEIESRMPQDELTVGVENISVIDDKEPLVAALRKANSTYPLSGSRQPRMVLSRIYVEESYIYRVTEPSPNPTAT